MSILESLITNRTAADVARWRALRDKGFDAMSADEKAEWLAGMRGAFNAADRNRITEAMVYLKGLYEQYGRQVTYTPVNITHKDGTTDTTWRMDDIPTDEQLTLIVKNLLAFWKGVESASGEVVEVWAGTRFGYVELAASVRTGDYTTLTPTVSVRSSSPLRAISWAASQSPAPAGRWCRQTQQLRHGIQCRRGPIRICRMPWTHWCSSALPQITPMFPCPSLRLCGVGPQRRSAPVQSIGPRSSTGTRLRRMPTPGRRLRTRR